MMDISIASLIELVREAGKILLGEGRTHVSEKGYADFVTEADMAVQRRTFCPRKVILFPIKTVPSL